MNAKDLIGLAAKYREMKDFITNEEAAKMALIVPFLNLLGYNPNNPREVRAEYAAPFTQGDGKKLPDRMDYAIFDSTGARPILVLEAKPLGADLRQKSPQLARYISQLEQLHFGIITDGCTYHFYGDLLAPNIMDAEPFFSFSLADDKEDWGRVAEFLKKFNRESFNADTLVIEAENSRYQQDMTAKLAKALKEPETDKGFMKWLTDGIYTSNRTTAVMERLTTVAKNAIEPALLRVLGRNIAASIEKKFEEADKKPAAIHPANATATEDGGEEAGDDVKRTAETLASELRFYEIVKDLCAKAGIDAAQILYKDTVYYFSVSYGKPSRWFARLDVREKRVNIRTHVATEEARRLLPGIQVEPIPPASMARGVGISRIILDSVEDTPKVRAVLLRSLEILLSGGAVDDGGKEPRDSAASESA